MPAVVIGAGPYGLATAAHLSSRGVAVRTFGEPMESWRRQMPRGMYLKSIPAASSIAAPEPGSTLAAFLSAAGERPLPGHQPVPIDSFIRYGLWFKERHVPEVDPRRVLGIVSGRRGFSLALDDGQEIAAGTVVIATGLTGAALLPAQLSALREAGGLGSSPVSHGSEHTDLSLLAGGRVAVLGAGQSALESAALLNEARASVELFVRGSRLRFANPPADVKRQGGGTLLKPESPLGPGWSHVAVSRLPGAFRHLPPRLRLCAVANMLGPSGAWWLRERVQGRFPIRLEHSLQHARRDGQRVALTFSTGLGGKYADTFDYVVAGTGYRVDVDHIQYLDPELRRGIIRVNGNWPALGSSFESSVPGLYFVGLAAAGTFGPLMRFVCGTGFAARRVSMAIAGGHGR